MRNFYLTLSGLVFILNVGYAQDQWPRDIEAKQARITLYQPQPEVFSGDKLSARAAVSVTQTSQEPIFGAVWMDARVATDRNKRIVSLVDLKVTNVKFPQAVDSVNMRKLKNLLETEIIKWDLELSLDELLATLEVTEKEKDTNDNFKTKAPEIIISSKPSVLVLIDGEPKFEKIEDTKLERVMNSPYFVVKDKDGKHYLNADEKWYVTSSIMGEWKVTSFPPKEVKKQEEKFSKDQPVSEANKAIAENEKKKEPPQIIVRTVPAEMILTNGASVFTPIQGTQLLYVKNTVSHVFMNIETQEYFILISGRWYQSKNLNGPWIFIASDKLPADFAKIPEGSEKDIVLASVAGTPAAKEALMDAQVPQTAAVDRKTATATVKYDGEPKFELIEGTTLSYAVNTSSSVILSDKTYYACENAVWFDSKTPTGPWTVSTEVPKDVQKIPPSSPVYNVKYVYIYDSTPEVVYVGYTPGYVGCYAYGPTVVYGTGYYYNPWYGPYYYPRPVTYGMGMQYNPYMGWSIGISFHIGGPYYGGFYGPPMYHPPYHGYHHNYYGGGNNVRINTGDINIGNGNNNRGDNIYDNRNGVKPSTRPSNGQASNNRPSTQPANKGQNNNARPSATPSTGGPRNTTNNNVMADKNGNVYQRQGSEWKQNNGSDWQSSQQNNRDLDQQQMNRDRGMQRSNNASQMNRGGGGMNRGGGGGRRR
ncbi:MAG: hypothetical protein AABY93_18120 [Bacteroidota bacterium]